MSASSPCVRALLPLRFLARRDGHGEGMAERYDAIVIGAGPGGEVCAGELADAGMRVAIAEDRLVAGECSYWACMPTKAFLRPGEVLAEARHAPGAAQAVSGALDADEVFNWRDVAASHRDDSDHLEWLDEKGIELIRGKGTISGPGVVEIDGESRETERIVIATGSDPAIPPIEGLRQIEGLWTNRQATEATEVPERLLVLGGGPVGSELAQGFARLGSSVVIAEGADRLVPGIPEQAGALLRESFESEGIELRLGSKVSAAEKNGDRFKLIFDDADNVEGDRLLVATGRVPRIHGLGLDTVGVSAGEEGIEIDARCRAAEGVWAIGDAADKPNFTHVAKYQGRIAAADMLGKEAKADYRALPRTVFTDPQLAAVGETEGAKTATAKLSSTPRSSTYLRESERAKDGDELPGFLTLVSDGEKLTGAFAAGPESGEWLQQATLAIRAEVPLATLLDTIQPYPTFSEAFALALGEL
jgi:pyruvate/2-oxoglutarate dehydrogenase complex dihydrolipoamide dehydrogenase (E3) component